VKVKDNYLLAEFVLHIVLDTAQHKRFDDHMQSTKLASIEPATLVPGSILNVPGEPLVGLVMRIENAQNSVRDTSVRRPQPPKQTSTYPACCSESGFLSTTTDPGSGIQAKSSSAR
jgi:hypothetical protein